MKEQPPPLVYFWGEPPQQQNQPPQPNPIQQKISEDAINKNIDASTRNLKAIARQNESKLILDGLQEIRSALENYSVGKDDTGNTGRPPIESAFFEAERGMLQTRYLKMYISICSG